MFSEALLYIYFLILIVGFGITVYQKNHLTKADRWISRLFLATIVFETCSEIAARTLKNNMYVYHVWNPIELLLICMYFNSKVETLNKRKIGILIATIGVALGIINACFLQPPNTINSIFLLYEGFAIIGLGLFAFYDLARREVEVLNNVHFWITTILMVYWSVVFVYWGMYYHFLTSLKQYHDVISNAFWLVNVLCYSGIAIVFMNYRKMISTSG